MGLDKFKTLPQLKDILETERKKGKKIALANGVFDLLHVGHIRYLAGARELADLLAVAVNSDNSTRRNKGEGRPVVPETERIELLSSLEMVDYLTLFNENTVERVIKILRPDFQVKGTDYREDTVPEAPIVEKYGGQVRIAGDPKDHSSTEILEMIAQMEKKDNG